MKAMLAFRSAPLEQLRPGYDRRDVAAQKRMVAETFADAGWHTPYLLDAMADSPDFFFDTLAQARVPQLSRGRAVLVGDAGHCPSPLTGLGTALADLSLKLPAIRLVRAQPD
jgi:2-polyprenyl-6-methoxyphenol hydroxylase-like FAD-dependent oxidoreductase